MSYTYVISYTRYVNGNNSVSSVERSLFAYQISVTYKDKLSSARTSARRGKPSSPVCLSPRKTHRNRHFFERRFSKMSLKLLLLSTAISFFAIFNGVQSYTDEELINIKKHRYYDTLHFSKYGIDDFDIFNRQCFLAFNVYLHKELYSKKEDNPAEDASETDTIKTLEKLREYNSRVYRTFNVELKKTFTAEDIALCNNKIDFLIKNIKKPVAKIELNELALGNIDDGLREFLWSTEKEIEIIAEHKKDDESTLTLSAFKICSDALNEMTTPTAVLDSQVKDMVAKEFGNALILMTNAEYENLQSKKLKIDKYVELLKIWKSAFEVIFKALQFVLSQIDFQLNRIPELEYFPRYTNVRVELMIILKQLYFKVTTVTQDMYVLYSIMDQPADIIKSYEEFINDFKVKWDSLFHNKGAVNDSKFPQTMSPLLKDSRIRPSLIRYLAKIHDSWTQAPPDPSNINHMKVILFESSLWLTVIKHNLNRMLIYTKIWAVEELNKALPPKIQVSSLNGIPLPRTRKRSSRFMRIIKGALNMMRLRKKSSSKLKAQCSRVPSVFGGGDLSAIGSMDLSTMTEEELVSLVVKDKINESVVKSFEDNKDYMKTYSVK